MKRPDRRAGHIADNGGGLKAYFTLESQFNPDTGQFAGNTGRQAYGGLGDQRGMVTFGKQYSSLAEGMLNFSLPAPRPPMSRASGGWASTTGRPTPSDTRATSARCPPRPTILGAGVGRAAQRRQTVLRA
ncbi:porin [Cupriavidus necator]